MRIYVLCAFAALFTTIHPVWADTVPRYDVEAHCSDVASFGGSYSAQLDQSCFEMEQAAYDGLRDRWPTLTASIRQHCDEVARFGGSGSYSLLSSCIQMEEQATRATTGRSFNY